MAFTTDVVMKVELVKNLDAHPQNAEIVKLPWLKSVPVEEDEDVQLVAKLRRLWGSEKGRDHGEAEVVASCRRYGWTAVLDDSRGRDAAAKYGVAVVSSTGLLVAAAAFHHIPLDDAWILHRAIVRSHKRATLPPSEDYKGALGAAIRGAKRVIAEMEGEQWPLVLADHRIDKLVARAAAAVRADRQL